MKLLVKLIFIAAFSMPGFASAGEEGQAARDFIKANEKDIVTGFFELLSMPNVAENKEDIRNNAESIAKAFQARWFETEILEAPGGPVSLFASRDADAEKTITIYIHFDGQPVDESRWASPPFEPVLRAGRLEDDAEIIDLKTFGGNLEADWRVYGRSASDDKAPIIALLAAMDALDGAGIKPSVNIKVFMDGAEEAGSPNLQALIEKYGDKLASDYWLFFDGPQDQRGNPRVVLGVRGVIGFELTVYGPVRGLHSGHYGNFAPNPSLRLAHLLSSMRDESGNTLIKGFYDEVRAAGDLEKSLIAAIPEADSAIMVDAGISAREYPGLRYEETHLIPALNIRGLQAGGVEEKARNIIDSRAKASIGIRMVPDMTIAETQRVVEAHIEGEGYYIVRQEPTLDERLAHPKIALVRWGQAGYPAVRTNADDPFVAKTIAIMQDITGGETLVYPILGGSLPLAHIVLPLGVPFAIVPIANQDNSQHAANENIRLGNLFKGIEIYAALLAGLGE